MGINSYCLAFRLKHSVACDKITMGMSEKTNKHVLDCVVAYYLNVDIIYIIDKLLHVVSRLCSCVFLPCI